MGQTGPQIRATSPCINMKQHETMIMKNDFEPLLHSIPTAQSMLGGISRATTYRRIADGKLEAVKLGSRTMITRRSILRAADGEK